MGSVQVDLAAERAVLGAVLLKSDAIFTAAEEASADDFQHAPHRAFFAAMVELANKSRPIDNVTLSEELSARGELGLVGGLVGVVALGEAVATAANVRHYARIVHEKANLRRLGAAGAQIVQLANNPEDPAGAVDEAERLISQIAQSKTRSGPVPTAKIVVEAFKDIEARSERRLAVTGIATGLHDLDEKTAGLQNDELVIIAGRPSMGKTALAMDIGLHAATIGRKHVAVFSLEMGQVSLVQRMLSSAGRVDSQRLRTGFLTDDDWPRLARAAGVVGEANLQIDDSGGLTMFDLRSKCRRMKAAGGLDLVLIDYLQLMSGDPDKSREQQIAEISRMLKGLAKDLHIPVVALSQLNRSVEQRTDKRPGLSDLRESGALEQDADVIVFVYRDEVYDPDTKDKGIAELIVGKQRNGPIGTVRTRFFNQWTRFDNLVEA